MILVCATVQLPASSSNLLQMLEAAAHLNRHTLLEHGMPSHSKDIHTGHVHQPDRKLCAGWLTHITSFPADDDGAVANLNNANENSLSGESLYSHLQQVCPAVHCLTAQPLHPVTATSASLAVSLAVLLRCWLGLSSLQRVDGTQHSLTKTGGSAAVSFLRESSSACNLC